MFDLAVFQEAFLSQLAPALIWGFSLGILAGVARVALGGR